MKVLANRTAIITGASRGLGLYIARALAAEKMNLVLAARSQKNLERVATSMGELGVGAIAVPTDVTDRSALEALVAAADAEFGGVDLLVNNAGVLVAYPYHKLAIEDIEHVLRINLNSAMLLTRLVLPGMLDRGYGHIVNLSSTAGKFGPPFDEIYAATKAGLIGFTESLRAEYKGTGVSASAICPGYVEEAGMYADGRERAGLTAPGWVGRTTPRAVARAVVKAVKRDQPEVIVNFPFQRPMSIVAEASPRFAEWVLIRFGAWAPFVKGAKLNEKAKGSMTGLFAHAPARAKEDDS